MGCRLTNKTCSHLDSWIQKTGNRGIEEVPAFSTDKIEEAPQDETKEYGQVEGLWRLFKDLRAFGLKRHQIQLVIDKAILGLSFRTIETQRGWTSYGTLRNEYKRTIELLREKGWGR